MAIAAVGRRYATPSAAGDASRPSSTFVQDGMQQVAAFDATGALDWEARWGPGIDALVEWKDVKDVKGLSGRHVELTDTRNSVVAAWSAGMKLVAQTAEHTPEGRVVVRDAQEDVLREEMGPDHVCPGVAGRNPRRQTSKRWFRRSRISVRPKSNRCSS